MHSSVLRGSDFHIAQKGSTVSHADFFASFEQNHRLGLVTEGPAAGLGAAVLVMAYVTAFYDRRRTDTDEFFSYPDFFSFQTHVPVTDYGMFDIWPEHKNVALPSNVLSPLTDRGVNILVVPLERESHRTEPADNRERVILDSLRRNVDVCYAYSKSGHIAESDLQITCSDANLCKWGQRVLESGSSDEGALCEWNEAFVEGSLTQSYRRIDLTTALTHI